MTRIVCAIAVACLLAASSIAYATTGIGNDPAAFSGAIWRSSDQPISKGRATIACLPAAVRGEAEQVVALFGGWISSTHRPGAHVAGSGHLSMHASCRAADIHVPRSAWRSAFAWLRDHRIGGLGWYRWGFHIDNGDRRDWGPDYASRYRARHYARRHARRYAHQHRRGHRPTRFAGA